MQFPPFRRRPGRRAVPASTFRPRVECLEGRDLPSTVVVHPGQSIQAAVMSAAPGTTIAIEPGVYKEAVSVSTANITLLGLPGPGGVVIENPGGLDDGITVTAPNGGFVLSNVTVRDFNDNGVLIDGVNGFQLLNVRAVNNGQYGLFPVLSANGVIQFCSASGSHDTGIYVGQSSNVAVRFNSAHDNVNGFEVENSTGVRAFGNLAYGNTVGIFVDLMPPVEGITVTTASNNTIAGNVVLDNNRPNNASPDDLAAAEQSGVGVLVVGTTSTTVKANVVVGNDTGGIVLLSGLDLEALGALGALPPGTYAGAGVDPNPELTSVRDNVVLFNGLHPTDPTQPHDDLIASPDALMGHGNHWKGNLFLTSFPEELP
jgi:parallel beta-helix repeat protein